MNRKVVGLIHMTFSLLLLLGLLQTSVAQAAWRTQTSLPYPILFVTQTPIVQDFTTIASTFGNHRGSLDAVGRGGDLWIRYPDGTLKNLTAAAGYGIAAGLQAGANAIAVRDPAVDWSGSKAVFSMVMGAPTKQYDYSWQNQTWQIYEITGLGRNETPVINKLPNQPAQYNNISPIYASDGRIIFTSDRPRNGEAHLYPQRDEYELAPTVSGLWSLDPATGDLRLLNHAPSGDFTPIIDSYGRLLFTQWDHMQRDQQADADADDSLGDNQCNNNGNRYGTFNYVDESANAAYDLNVRSEIFPEPRHCRKDLLAGSNLQGHSFNHFFPWMSNQDGTEGEILNHLGRHELHSYFERTFLDDPNLIDYYGQLSRFNPNPIENMFQIKEDAQVQGRYYGVDAPEFGTHAAGRIIRIDAPPSVNADHISVTYVTRRLQSDDANHSGLFREPLSLADGRLVAVHTQDAGEESGGNTTDSSYEFRLKFLIQGGDGYWTAGEVLTSGISKTLSYWSPDDLITYSGPLWELNPIEVRARPLPPLTVAPVLAPGDQQLFDQAGVNLADFQNYLLQNNLAVAVVRNVTTRDDFDLQQPFNLRLPGGTQTLNPNKAGKVYDVTHLQFFQGDLLRGWTGCCSRMPQPGRRILAQVLHDGAAVNANPPLGSAPAGSLPLAADGSLAAFVPARRALTWQLTDAAGTGIVRERYWLTFQPGEIRICSSCHGLSELDQAGRQAPTNPPQALLALLNRWKAQNSSDVTPTVTPIATPTAVNPATATPTATPSPTAPAVQTPAQIAGCNLFPSDNVWNAHIDGLPLDANSDVYINTIGAAKTLHADFGAGLWNGGPIGISYTVVAGSQVKVPITFDYADESDPGPYPIPANAPIEGGPNSSGDRHVLVVDRDRCLLYETWSTYPQPSGSWHAGSGAVFDLNSNALRPDGWTSADAAGLPILPGLVRYEEVLSGEIKHAIRFTAPQTRRAYVWPARHYASSLTGAQHPPMGQRFRLKASFDITPYAPEVQVILKAMKKYGIILADNGSAWYISGAPDERWNNDHLRQLGQIAGSNFEAVDASGLMADADTARAGVRLGDAVYLPLVRK
jgi:hypothetical protein